MKIIVGTSSFDVLNHAAKAIRAQQEKELQRGVVIPRGVSIGLAKFQHSCDDCGEHYWDGDEYGCFHTSCRSSKKVGF